MPTTDIIYVAKQTSKNMISICRESRMYEPKDKEWIKEKIYAMLRKQAGK